MMKGLTNSTYELTENSDEEVVWGADNGLSTVDFLQFNEDGTSQVHFLCLMKNGISLWIS